MRRGAYQRSFEGELEAELYRHDDLSIHVWRFRLPRSSSARRTTSLDFPSRPASGVGELTGPRMITSHRCILFSSEITVTFSSGSFMISPSSYRENIGSATGFLDELVKAELPG